MKFDSIRAATALSAWASIAAIAALGIALSGCATSGPTFQTLYAAEPPVPQDQARIYMYRPGQYMGWALQPAIQVNGVKVGDAVPGGFFFVDEPAGTYEISATTESKESITTTVKPGETRYVRFDPTFGILVGHITPTLVWPEQGASEIQKLHYLGTAAGK